MWSCDLTANSLTVGAVLAIVFGTLLFVGVGIGVIILCICCLTPSCPCYYNKYATSRTTRTVVVAQPAPQVVTMAATTTNTTAFPEPPPAYNPDPGYVQQPYPPAPPPPGYPSYPSGYPNY